MLASFLGEEGFHSVFSTGNTVFSSRLNNAVGFDEEAIQDEARQASALEVAAGAFEMMARQPAASRRYAHMHLMDPHLPYNPPPEYLTAVEALDPIDYDLSLIEEHLRLVADIDAGVLDAATAELGKEHIRLRYDADVHHLDDQLAQIWDQLDRIGALDDTLVVVWSDHGEQHIEHGHQGHDKRIRVWRWESAITDYHGVDWHPKAQDKDAWAASVSDAARWRKRNR